MKPKSPVIFQVANSQKYEILLGKYQPQYIPLPAYVITNHKEQEHITRWSLSLKERIFAVLFGNVWISQYTFNQPFQPIRPTVFEPYTKWDGFGKKEIDNKFIRISRDVLHTQSFGCWLTIHVGTTVIYLKGWNKNSQGIRIELNAPIKSQNKKDKNKEFELGKWGVSC